MKIKRFVASNMRQALLSVRKEQGPNAVILSNRRVPDGIEVVAAVDYDESLITQSFGRQQSEAAQEPSAPAASPTGDDEHSATPAADHPEPDWLGDEPANPSPFLAETEEAPLPAETHGYGGSRAPEISAMREEMHGMRSLLEDQLSSLAWNDEARRDPATVCILRHYAALGLDADVARSIAAQAQPQTGSTSYMERAARALAGALPVLNDSLLDKGGVIAIVGPTGVGKTTSIAKLAARFALRHGRDQVALISTDSFRIGAQEQLATFAQILDVPVHMITDEDDLSVVLGTLADKKLVLIDTAGVSQRAQGLARHLHAISAGSVNIQMYLTLAANGQSGTLDEVIREFGCVAFDGCILTKVDEATSLGPAFSAIIRHQLPIGFLANGQKVPEDLHSAVGKQASMVKYAGRLMRESRLKIDEEFMARNFGEVRTHAFA